MNKLNKIKKNPKAYLKPTFHISPLTSNKGITLTSLVIYITVMFVVLATIMRVMTYFRKNMTEAADVTFETEFNKLNLYLLDEAKRTGNGILEITDGIQITFLSGNKYTYDAENKTIYLNDNIKVCENVESCLFEQKTAENGKNVLALTIKINGIEKNVNYVMTTQGRYVLQLPNEYQQVEYIESTGTQYIDTGVVPTDKVGCYIDFQPLSGGTIFGSITQLSVGYYGINMNTASKQFEVYWEKSIGKYGSFNYNTRYVIEFNYMNSKKFYVDGKEICSLPSTDAITNNTIHLFKLNEGTTSYTQYISARLYGTNVIYGETLVRDFVPCYRKSDNVVGLYDLVNDVFYTNEGTGEFIKGENVTAEIKNENEEFIAEEDYIIENDLFKYSYQRVEYIESTGTQYIDTGIKPNNLTGVEIEFMYNSLDGFIYGSRTSYTSNDAHSFIIDVNAQVYPQFDGQQTNVESLYNETGIKYILNNSQNGAYINGELIKEYNTGSFSSNYSMFLFGLNQNNTLETRTFKGKIYYCKILDNGTLVRSFIPCYRKSDNVVGLYDLVNGKFYANEGTGEFIKGLDV